MWVAGTRRPACQDGALSWMIGQASALGLAFKAPMLKQIRPDHQGVLHDSSTGVFSHLRSRPRQIPALDGSMDALLHTSAVQRRGGPAHFPGTLPAVPPVESRGRPSA